MTPPPAAPAAVAAFARRTALAGFVQGAAQGAFVIGATFAVAGIAVRCAGSELAPNWWWMLALAPVFAAGLSRARRVAISRATAACHLDRRLHLDGLLVAAHEVALDADWHEELAKRLRGWRTALPAVRWEELCWRPLAALALAALVACWPATPLARPRAPGGLASVLAGLRERLQQATVEHRIAPETLAELGQRVAELAASAVADDPAAWRELDELAQRVAREELLTSLDPGAAGERDRGREDRTREALQHAFTALQQYSRESGIPEVARSLLEQAMQQAANDPQQLARNIERLRELAARIGDSGGELAEQLKRAGVELHDLERLRGLASHLREAATPERAAEGGEARTSPRALAGEQGAAPVRGPGGAPPRFVDPVAVEPANVFTLPAGKDVPHEWVPAGDRTSDPAVSPVASAASGTAPASGAGGATWQLQLAPRHRAVVQRFFAGGEPASKERR